jgi:nitric oxide reductase large subunit
LGKYLFLVVALFVFQVFIGGFTAHYTVEGQQFYGIDVSRWFPYSLTRTWHIQAALFWIATGFLAAGLFLAPLINGRQGSEVPEARRGCAVLGAGRRGRGLLHRQLPGDRAGDAARVELLARPSGL